MDDTSNSGFPPGQQPPGIRQGGDRFAMVPAALFAVEGVTPSDIGWYALFAQWSRPGGCLCWPSNEAIAELGNTTPRRVQDAKARLVEKGLMRIVDEGGGTKTRTYVLSWPYPADQGCGFPPTDAEIRRGGTRKSASVTDQVTDPLFSTFGGESSPTLKTPSESPPSSARSSLLSSFNEETLLRASALLATFAEVFGKKRAPDGEDQIRQVCLLLQKLGEDYSDEEIRAAMEKMREQVDSGRLRGHDGVVHPANVFGKQGRFANFEAMMALVEVSPAAQAVAESRQQRLAEVWARMERFEANQGDPPGSDEWRRRFGTLMGDRVQFPEYQLWSVSEATRYIDSGGRDYPALADLPPAARPAEAVR